MNPIDEWSIHAIFEVTKIRRKDNLWKTKFVCYTGSKSDLTLYSNGGEPCPFQLGDFYATDDAQHGGWKLTRLAETDQTRLKRQRDGLPVLTLATSLRRSPQGLEHRCRSVYSPDNGSSARCGFVIDHQGPHWSGHGASDGYQWETF